MSIPPTPQQSTPEPTGGIFLRKKHKFNAKPAQRTWADGTIIKLPSQKHARYYDNLLLRQREGSVIFFLREVPFHLPGNVTYRADFVEFLDNDTVRVVDVKGRRTKEYIRNKKQVEALYPVIIEEE